MIPNVENKGETIRLFGCSIEQQPKQPYLGNMVGMVEQPKQPKQPYLDLRRNLLENMSKKQSFQVAVGPTKWIDYKEFNPDYNLREILKDEIVIEFDSTDLEIVMKATSQTGINLFNAGIYFEYWDHGGKSPHLHIRDLPIGHLDDEQRKTFKKLFIRKYVPMEYLKYVDFTLTGTHLIALEWAEHWKGCYGVKKLISIFDGVNKNSWGYENEM